MKNYLLAKALKHSNACQELLEQGLLSDAVEYCRNQRIEPPQCSLIGDSADAERKRMHASEMLADCGWWAKRLKILAARDVTMVHVRGGAARSSHA